MNGDFLLIIGYFEAFSKFSDFAIDLDSLSEEFCEVSSVENFIFYWFGAINAEVMVDFLLGDLSVGSFSHG